MTSRAPNSRHNVRQVILIAASTLATTNSLMAENWPSWRGPEGTGVSHESTLPLTWSTTQNIGWKVKLPEPGNSTPIVWGQRIFVTQAIVAEKRRTLMCLDLRRRPAVVASRPALRGQGADTRDESILLGVAGHRRQAGDCAVRIRRRVLL